MDLDKVESLFHEALGLPPGTGRQEWLVAKCNGDSVLFREVSSLVDAQTRMAEKSRHVAPLPSAQFGAYRPVRLLGRGGMSAVYLAARADGHFQQSVALKVMAGYLADDEFFRRFEAERQFLASLNHRNITRLLDGGISSGGDPFLVTEYVDGEPIDCYCDRRRLGVEDRLRIFLQVCEATDYAHCNLIVHRDLKPANILVNGEGEAKLLDFGAAALAAAHDTPTVTRNRMLTPRYASPEQLRGERANIPTDVFSLGVVLYELLTGVWPFGDPHSEMHGMERSHGHSTANSLLSAITEEAARVRSASREQLRRVLKGDLSAIALKALEPDPARRYHSVRSMAADLENFLDGRPVAARRQTVWYRTGKFLRRRWLPVAAGLVFASALTAAALIANHQARVARAEALKAEKVNQFLNDMLSNAADLSFDAKTTTVAQMLEAAEVRLESNWNGDPRAEATLRRSLGASFTSLGQYGRAKAQLEKALATFQSLDDEKEVAETVLRLANVASAEGRSEDAVAGYEDVLHRLKKLGKDAPALLVFAAKHMMGNALSVMLNRRLPEARNLLDEAIALGNRDSSIPRRAVAGAMAQRAIMWMNEGKWDEAEVMFGRSLAVGRQEDPNGFWQVAPLFGLATLIAPKDPAGAAELSRQRYKLIASRLGEDNPTTAISKILWARQRADAGEPGDALRQVIDAMRIVHRGVLSTSMDRWFALSSSAHVMNQAKRYREAESLAREMWPVLEANHLAENDGRRAESLFELGRALHGENKDLEARETLRKAAVIYRAANRPGMAKRVEELLSQMK